MPASACTAGASSRVNGRRIKRVVVSVGIPPTAPPPSPSATEMPGGRITRESRAPVQLSLSPARVLLCKQDETERPVSVLAHEILYILAPQNGFFRLVSYQYLLLVNHI